MISRPGLDAAALVAAVLLLGACDDLLPGRRASPPVAVAADSAPAAKESRRSRATTPSPATPVVEPDAAFRQIRQSLRRLVAAEQGFYAENGTYSDDPQRLGFRPAGASQVEILWITRLGWAARGTHPALPGRDCVTYAGVAEAVPSTRRLGRSGGEGVIVCDDRTTTSPAATPPLPAPQAEAAEPPPDTTSALDAVAPAVQMRVDLRKLADAQAAYFGTQGAFARRLEHLQLQFGWQRGVEVTLLHADQRSWSARATHDGYPGGTCVVWYGTPATRPATSIQRKVPERSGVPACD